MKPQMEKESVDTLFSEAVAGLKSISIDEVAALVKNNEYLFARVMPNDLTDKVLKQECRRLMKKVKDEFGFPLFMSVRTIDANGEEKREYKQPQLFDMAEYEQAVSTYGHLAIHYAQTAVKLRNRCKVQFGKQIPLPFNEAGFLLD